MPPVPPVGGGNSGSTIKPPPVHPVLDKRPQPAPQFQKGSGTLSGSATVAPAPSGSVAKQAEPPPGPAKPSPEVQEKLDNLELQIDNLNGRATAVNNSLNTMQRSMQKDGMNLRGDIASRFHA